MCRGIVEEGIIAADVALDRLEGRVRTREVER